MNGSVQKGSDKQAWVWLAAALVAVPGVLRDVSVYFWKAGRLATTRPTDRFAGLAVPAGERLGFMTDVAAGDADRRYYETLYALAPAIVVRGPDERLVVADVRDPAAIAEICARWKLHVAAKASPGTALLERD